MNRDLQKEEEFYAKPFKFSYSSLNKLVFSPTLFYKDYILKEREIKTDRHLVEGKLVHCLLFEPDNFDKKFNLVPGKTPSDNVRKVLKDMSLHTDAETLESCEDFIILDSLKALNLYQSLKTDEQRLAKIRVSDYEPYWKFLSNTHMDVIDQDTYSKCTDYVNFLEDNESVKSIINETSSDFDLDPITIHVEKYLESDLSEYEFGLHGYIDFLKVDSDKKIATICDLKTTSKSIVDFKDTVDFYNYWLQAAIYSKLVYDFLGDDRDEYTIEFKFIVIDQYKQVYVFDVTDDTFSSWANGFLQVLNVAKYHFNEKNYSLPYEFLVNRVKL